MIGSYGEKRKPLHYIHSQDGPAYTVACWGCSLQSSHSLAQNDCGHISNIPADHVRRGKGWMLSVDAVVVPDGERPRSAPSLNQAQRGRRRSAPRARRETRPGRIRRGPPTSYCCGRLRHRPSRRARTRPLAGCMSRGAGCSAAARARRISSGLR